MIEKLPKTNITRNNIIGTSQSNVKLVKIQNIHDNGKNVYNVHVISSELQFHVSTDSRHCEDTKQWNKEM